MKRFGFSFAVLTAVVCGALAIGQADPFSRVPGNHPLDAEHRATIGNLDAAAPLALEIHLKLRNEAELDRFLEEVQNPHSSQFRKFLKPGEFDRKYAPLKSDLDAVAGWLRLEGFTITSTAGSVQFTGTVARAEHTFAVHILKLSATEFSNVEDPIVPARFASLIGSIQGLDNLTVSAPLTRASATKDRVVARPTHKLTRAEALRQMTGSSALVSAPEVIINNGVSYGDADMRNTYDVPSTSTIGGGDCLGIIGDSDFLDAALTAFTDQFSDLPAINVTRVLAPSNPGKNLDETEALLDLEWSHVMAPGAPIKFYLGNKTRSASGIQNSIAKAVSDDVCKVISISFVFCGTNGSFYTGTLDSLFKKAASQGQSVFVGSGDFGAAGYVPSNGSCVANSTATASEMAADPNVTAVGGTQILSPDYDQNEVAQGYATETVWNDAESGHGGNGASGGGVSAFFSKPSYQTGPGVPGGGKRDIPDVSLLSGSPRVFYAKDQDGQADFTCCEGGTSLATPLWAGLAKDIEAEIGALGSINPTIYTLANQQFGGSATPNGFHDVTAGDNAYNGVTGVSAGPGYDLATGWGSVDFSVFKTAFEGNQPTMTPTPVATTSVTAAPASIDFRNVDATGSSTSHRVLFVNRGPVGATLGTVSVPSGFNLASDTCSNQTVPARRNCAVGVEFQPLSPGAASGPLSVSYNGGSSSAIVNLSGNGTMVLVKGPARVAFPTQAAGSTGTSRPVTIINESRSASVTFGGTPTIMGPFVMASDTCSNQTIGPRLRCAVGLEFSPLGDSMSKSTLSGSIGLSYMYGANPGMVPSVPLSGRVK